MSDLPIYNCHIHIFTTSHVPRGFAKTRIRRERGALVTQIKQRTLTDEQIQGINEFARMIGDSIQFNDDKRPTTDENRKFELFFPSLVVTLGGCSSS